MPKHKAAIILMFIGVIGGRAAAAELAVVNVALTLSITDVNIFIAEKRGYFGDEGLSVNIINADSAARVLPSLAAGDIDVAGGAPSAAFYNAVARGIGVRIVSDKSSTPPGRYSQTLVVRQSLFDSGRVKTIADLRGLRVATAAVGSAAMGTLNRIYKMTGMKPGDIERVYLNVPQQIAALQNGAIDAAFPTEPIASQIIRQGIAAKLMTDDQIYPGHQIAVMYYSGKFREERPQVAMAFMRAYLRGVRDQNRSVVGGKIAGKDADEFLTLIAENTPVKDKELARTLTISFCDDNGLPNIESLKEDFEVFKREGLLEGTSSVDMALDLSFVKAAALAIAPK